MKFNELDISTPILKSIELMGFEDTTEIQAKAIPPILNGKDIIGQSQTGTGKTAAFAIPILEKIDNSIRNPQVIVLCPTRELAIQVCNEFRKIAKFMHNTKVFPVYGGEPIYKQIVGLKKGVHIIVGTPGRLMDHMRRKTLLMDSVHTIILDEADEMLNMGFREDIETILNAIENKTQTILFSATMPKSILDITHRYQNNPQLVKITKKELTTDTITQRYYHVQENHKVEALCRLIDVYHPKLSLIFCNTKKRVDDVCDILNSRGFTSDKIHGDMNQVVRLSVLNKFNKGLINILVATDVAARGLDIKEVEAVFNYDVPENEEYYVHRIGRTGRAGKKGRSFTLVSKSEIRKIRNIIHYIKKDIPKKKLPSVNKVNSIKIEKYLERLASVIDTENLGQYEVIIEKLSERGYSSERIAAALLKSNLVLNEDKNLNISFEEKKHHVGAKRGMVRLYINAGKSHQVTIRDIVGAITGESKIKGHTIGAIDMFDNYSFVEIPDNDSQKVIRAMNKTRIKGRNITMEVASGKKRKR